MELKPIDEMKAYFKWHQAGLHGFFMARPIADMTRAELHAVIGCTLMREKHLREGQATMLRVVGQVPAWDTVPRTCKREEKMMATSYGERYWCIHNAAGESIHLWADSIRVDSTGALICTRIHDKEGLLNFAFAAGSWILVYAASALDGGALAVEHWQGKEEKT